MNKLSVLFVCTENICRSPLAEALLQDRLKQLGLHRAVVVDSAGTFCSQPGHKPDPRVVKIGKAQGLKFRGQKSRKVNEKDFECFDLILAMDSDNRNSLVKSCPLQYLEKVKLIMEYASDSGAVDVPDPYYGSAMGFKRVLAMLCHAIEGLVDVIGLKYGKI